MEERWMPVRESRVYEASDQGKIRNVRTNRIMKTNTDSKGYEQVCLHENGKQVTRRVHKLVAEAFDDDYENKRASGLEITHKNGDRSKNFLDNLEWKTKKEIINKTYQDGRKQTHRMRRIRCVETGDIYESIKACSEATGLHKDTISRRLNNPYIEYSGYHFEPVD